MNVRTRSAGLAAGTDTNIPSRCRRYRPARIHMVVRNQNIAIGVKDNVATRLQGAHALRDANVGSWAGRQRHATGGNRRIRGTTDVSNVNRVVIGYRE